jgi:polyphenol oxidase
MHHESGRSTTGKKEPAAPASDSSVRFWRPAPGHLPSRVWFGMATRERGTSTGPYASLNLGLRVGDEEEAVHENRKRLRMAAGMSGREPLMVHQVHGRTIVTASEAEHGPTQADGIRIREGEPWVAVSAADCAPVAVVAPDGSAAVLLHCGWRGAREGIPSAAVTLLRGDGFRPGEILAAIGPCLHACCFPIGPEVAAEFDPTHLLPHPSGQPSLDLPGVIVADLLGAGVARDRIVAAPDCTSCFPDRWFSHRRDRGVTGRHWALLRIEPL